MHPIFEWYLIIGICLAPHHWLRFAGLATVLIGVILVHSEQVHTLRIQKGNGSIDMLRPPLCSNQYCTILSVFQWFIYTPTENKSWVILLQNRYGKYLYKFEELKNIHRCVIFIACDLFRCFLTWMHCRLHWTCLLISSVNIVLLTRKSMINHRKHSLQMSTQFDENRMMNPLETKWKLPKINLMINDHIYFTMWPGQFTLIGDYVKLHF